MTKQEKIVLYFLTALLILGIAVKLYQSRQNPLNLKIERANLLMDVADADRIIRQVQTVRINTADAQDFMRLPGIGPVLAGRIVKYRNKNGRFASVEDLKKVKGIGIKKYEGIKQYLVL